MRNKLRYQLFRAKNRAGKLYPKWRIRYLENGKPFFSEVGYTDKGRTEEKAKERLREEEHQRHLKALGMPVIQHRELGALVEDWLGHLARKGGKRDFPSAPNHVSQCRAKMTWWIKTLHLQAPGDVRLATAENAVAAAGIAVGTQDLYMTTLRAFLNWCCKNGYLGQNPLKGYRKHVAAPTFIRRPLTMAEFHRLLSVVNDRRALIYRMAVLTGMRRKELDSLTVASVDWKAGKVHLRAQDSKNRKAADFHLPGDFLAELYAFSAGRRMDEKLLQSISPSKSARTLHRHLRKAGIPVETPEGRIDFHSFRVTFLTLVNELGEDVKTVQELARHADPRLTFGTYTKVKTDRLKAVVDRVHAQMPAPNRDIPRLGSDHAGVTQASYASQALDFIGSEQGGGVSPRAATHPKDIPGHSQTFPDINQVKTETRARFEAATNPDIAGQTETEKESRRRHTLVNQIAEALACLPEADLQALLQSVHALAQRKAGAA